MDEITIILRKADLIFGLRPALVKFGFSPTEDIFITFKHDKREYTTEAISPVDNSQTTSLDTTTIDAAINDWLNKAEVNEEYQLAVGQKLGLPNEGDFEIEVKFSSTSKNYVARGRFCWPCYSGAGFCCWKP